MNYTIYQITNLINNKIYIGAHYTEDINDNYFGSSIPVKQAISKYGIENFRKDTLHIFDNSNDMFAKEAEIVNEDFVQRRDTYNLKPGGHGGWHHINNDPEKRKLVTEAARKYNKENGIGGSSHWTSEGRANIVASLRQQSAINVENGSAWTATAKVKRQATIAKNKSYSGSKNSQFGKYWISHPLTKEIKRINATELDYYINQRWVRGKTGKVASVCWVKKKTKKQ